MRRKREGGQYFAGWIAIPLRYGGGRWRGAVEALKRGAGGRETRIAQIYTNGPEKSFNHGWHGFTRMGEHGSEELKG